MASSPPPLSPSSSSFASTGSSTRGLSPGLSASAVLRYRRQYRRHGRFSSSSSSSAAAAAATTRTVAFVTAVLSALCAGSITVFSLYGHIFQERLHYSQFQVNGVAIAASIACYLPVPLFGYVCDRAGPAPLSLLASALFGLGYGAAAVLYKGAAAGAASGLLLLPLRDDDDDGGPSRGAYAAMVAAFVAIGTATCAMYLAAVATCAKNFGRGRHRGLALSAPIAAFGLSGMWQSQLGSRVLYERLPPRPPAPPDAPPRRGDVDVFAFFLFLAVLLFVVGLVGTCTLRVVDEDRLIDGAVEELERSGVLDGSGLFAPTAPAPAPAPARPASPPPTTSGRSTHLGPGVMGGGNGRASGGGASSSSSHYGAMGGGRADPFDPGHADDTNDDDEDDDDTDGGRGTETSSLLRKKNKSKQQQRQRQRRRQTTRRDDDHEDDALASRLLDPSKDDDDDNDDDDGDAAEARALKTWVLNAETRRFLTDHTMWLLALAFFLMTGPGEAYINNMGTVLQTLYPPGGAPPATTATQVSLFGLTSTVARLLTGTLTDWLAPQPQTQHLQVGGEDTSPTSTSPGPVRSRLGAWAVVSRITLLVAAALVLSAGLATLASGAVQGHGDDRFWAVSGLVGAGYGAVFSVTPIVITVIWGVENFGTNWGLVAMFPALGATLWGLVYSAGYQRGAGRDTPAGGDGHLCYGRQCYAGTFWAMAGSVWVACVLVAVAWKGRRGWAARGIVI